MATGNAKENLIIKTGQKILYPFLFVFCKIGIFIQLITLLTVVMPILIVVGLYWLFPKLIHLDIATMDIDIATLAANHPLTQIIAFVIGAILFVDFIKKIGEHALKDWDEFWEGWREISKDSEDPLRISKMKNTDRFKYAWSKYFTSFPKNIWATSKAAWKLSLKLVMATLLAWIAYPFIDPRKNTDDTATCNDIIFSVTFDNFENNEGDGVSSGKTQKTCGICLDETHQKWIDKFRQSIVEYAKAQEGATGKVPMLKVTGFASQAYVRSNYTVNSSRNSSKLNCEFANRRAIAVAAYLADKNTHKTKWNCSNVCQNFQQSENICNNNGPSNYVSKDRSFKVHIHQWTDPEKMQESKPARNIKMTNNQRHHIELLNRSVLITVPSGLC